MYPAGGATNMRISSAYMAHDRPAAPEELQYLAPIITARMGKLLISCDASTRYPFRDSSATNERSESLFCFIININLGMSVLCEIIKWVIPEEKINWTINSLSAYKSPSLDSLYMKVLGV